MEKQVIIILHILILLFQVSCDHGIKDSDLKIPYQTYIVDSTTTIYTFMMDVWGDEGYIMCKNADTTYISSLDMDPRIPIIESVSNDTIYMTYYCYKLYGDIDTTIIRKSIWEWAQKVGKYDIIQQRHYFLYGSGGLTVDTIDDIRKNRDSLYAYKDSKRIISSPICDIFTERRHDGYYLSTFNLDTIDTNRIMQRWTSYFVKNANYLLKL